MKKIKTTLLLTLLTLATLLVVGCGKKDKEKDDKTITVGANITPHSEILYKAKDILAKDGITLKVVEIEDSVTPNTGLAEGTLDANYFQHQPYLDDFNAENGTELVSIGAVHYEPFGIYSSKISSISELKDGAKVAVPNNSTNEARALLLLEQEGVITLKEDVGIKATVADIVDNPKNISFVEMDPSQLVNALADVDVAIINGNYAMEGGLSVNDALAVESDQSVAAKTYANIVVTTKDKQNDENLKKLVEVLQSDEIKQFIQEKYGKAVIPIN